MKKIFARIGSFLFISRASDSIRSSVIFIITQFVLLIGIVFLAECVFLFLGIHDIFLPFTQSLKQILEKVVF